MKTLLLVFVAVIALDVALARIWPKPQKCPQNERWKGDSDTCGEKNCKYIKLADVPRRCHPLGWGALDPKRICRSNEQCRPGLKSCGELQCRHFNSPPRKRPICMTDFKPRCFCRYGYCRNGNGKCIPIRRW
uniref:Putative secreted protein n=1 Tax=Amblyomma parvum TaxID=251391 RepID=A0A023FT42_AMBPA